MDQEHPKRAKDEGPAAAGAPSSDPAAPPRGPAGEEHPAGTSPSEKAPDAGESARREHENEPEHEDAPSFKAKLKKKDHELKELKKDLHELRDKYLRLAAEMENQRKRLDREKSDFLQFALADVLKDLLAVQDNFDRALKSLAGSENPSAVEGIGLIAKQLADLLRKRGVVEIEAAGKAFDPTIHSAVVSVETKEVSEPIVDEVFQKGYMLNDRLLRPALVKVLVPARD